MSKDDSVYIYLVSEEGNGEIYGFVGAAAVAETNRENGGRAPFHKFISAVNCEREKWAPCPY